jgi:hypothetical protein
MANAPVTKLDEGVRSMELLLDKASKLFPWGINKIQVKVTVTPPSLDLTIEGPSKAGVAAEVGPAPVSR